MSASTMTFEETLAALFELVGTRVTIRITAGAVGDPSVTIAFIDGALRSAIDRGPAVMAGPDPTYEEVTESDSRFFSVDDLDQTGFYVSPQAFVSAQWLGTDPSRCLWIEHGPNVVLSVVAHR